MTPALRLAAVLAGLILFLVGVLVLAPTAVPAIPLMVGYGTALCAIGAVLCTLAALAKGARR